MGGGEFLYYISVYVLLESHSWEDPVTSRFQSGFKGLQQDLKSLVAAGAQTGERRSLRALKRLKEVYNQQSAYQDQVCLGFGHSTFLQPSTLKWKHWFTAQDDLISKTNILPVHKRHIVIT